MRTPTLTLALAALLAAPSLAAGQDRRIAPTGDTPRVEIPDRDIAPIAEAARRGEPIARVESDWRALLERHADGLREGDENALSIRLLQAAWAPLKGDLDEMARDVKAADPCARQDRAIESERASVERALAAGGDASAADVRAAGTSLEALSKAIESCRASLARSAEEAAKVAAVDERIAEPAAEDPAVEPTMEQARPGVAAFAGELQAQAGENPLAGEDTQMAQMELQGALEEIQQMLRAMSNLLKRSHETAAAIIRNLK